MYKNINSVFPEKNNYNEEKKSVIEIETFNKSSCESKTGNQKVLYYDWQLLSLSEPRDNKMFKPPNGNLHLSSYLRLGLEKPKTGISETHERLKEISKKDDYIALYPRRSTLNLFSHSLTEDLDRKEELKSSGFQAHPYNYGCMDYRTTSNIEYPSHFPGNKYRHNNKSDDNEPWLYYRRTLSYKDEELSTRNCEMKFNDDKMNLHDDIAVMKIDRYRSYDPINKKYTDPRAIRTC